MSSTQVFESVMEGWLMFSWVSQEIFLLSLPL